MQNTNYWYNAQIRHIILCVLRLFSNFQISEGLDSSNKPKLRRIPVTFMSTDKSVVYMLNNASDTILETVPRMILTISNVKLNTDKSAGATYYEHQTSITEKNFNAELDNYVYDKGNSYNITRLNPVPIGLEFKLYILTSMQDHKLQLFEQIRTLFTPTLELQLSENPLDWNYITAITLTNLTWSSKNTNLESSTLDSMDMSFAIDTHLDLPALVQRESIITQINNNVLDSSYIDDLLITDYNDGTRVYHSPTNNRIQVIYNEDLKRQEVILLPSEKCKTWYELFETYDLHYEGNKSPAYNTVYINCLTNANIEIRRDLVGSIYVLPDEPNKAVFNIFNLRNPSDLLFIDGILNPHEVSSISPNGEKYLILEDIGTDSQLWGKLYDENGIEVNTINKNCIVTHISNDEINATYVFINPETNPNKTLYIKDKSAQQYLYTYNSEYKMWIDFVNKIYNVGYWRISDRPIFNK